MKPGVRQTFRLRSTKKFAQAHQRSSAICSNDETGALGRGSGVLWYVEVLWVLEKSLRFLKNPHISRISRGQRPDKVCWYYCQLSLEQNASEC